MAHTAIMSNVRDPWNRSKKSCVCGGHNGTNAKRKLTHNSTRRKLEVRRERRFRRAGR